MRLVTCLAQVAIGLSLLALGGSTISPRRATNANICTAAALKNGDSPVVVVGEVMYVKQGSVGYTVGITGLGADPSGCWLEVTTTDRPDLGRANIRVTAEGTRLLGEISGRAPSNQATGGDLLQLSAPQLEYIADTRQVSINKTRYHIRRALTPRSPGTYRFYVREGSVTNVEQVN